MQIADHDEQPRGDFVRQEFGAPDRGLLRTLSQQVHGADVPLLVRRVARRRRRRSDVRRRADASRRGARRRAPGAGRPAAGRPRRGQRRRRHERDGALGESLLALKSQGVPVFTVGVGRETLARDIQIGRVSTPRIALKGTTLMIDVIITQTGFAGKTVTLDVEDEGRIVGIAAGEAARTTARRRRRACGSRVGDAGPRVFRFRVAPQAGELVTENNAREALIDVRDRREKILYFEGEPRSEMKFIRRAVHDDPESAAGRAAAHGRQQVPAARRRQRRRARRRLPEDARGAVRVSRPHPRQHRGRRVHRRSAAHDRRVRRSPRRRPADARRRRASFAEGGYAGTAVADVLPLVLDPSAREPQPARLTRQAAPTRAGAAQA